MVIPFTSCMSLCSSVPDSFILGLFNSHLVPLPATEFVSSSPTRQVPRLVVISTPDLVCSTGGWPPRPPFDRPTPSPHVVTDYLRVSDKHPLTCVSAVKNRAPCARRGPSAGAETKCW